jgi:hypothetical protein
MIEGNKGAARAALLGLALALALTAMTGCSGEDDPTAMTPAQADEALKLRQDYEAAVQNKDFEGAMRIADRLRKKYPESEEMATVRLTLDDTIARADTAASANRLANLWEYQQVAAGTGTQYTALLPSHVELDENGLPERTPDARLVLRIHPEWGKSAYLLLAQSQFTCGDPCAIQIAFDELPSESFEGEQADSGNGPALFITERERFYGRMRLAQNLTITLPKTNNVTPPKLHFEVSGYDASRLGAEF